MRFSKFDSFDESDIKGAYLKAKLGLGAFKKFESICEEERNKYFGDIRFDDEYVISTSQIARNLLFIGLSKHKTMSLIGLTRTNMLPKSRLKQRLIISVHVLKRRKG